MLVPADIPKISYHSIQRSFEAWECGKAIANNQAADVNFCISL